MIIRKAISESYAYTNMWADTILILFISICTALLGEGKVARNSVDSLTNFKQEAYELLNL